MAYTPNPMHEFNKNHPFTILSKEIYDKIMDTLQTHAKAFILRLIIAGIFYVILVAAVVVKSIYFHHVDPVGIGHLLVDLIIVVWYFFHDIGRARYYMKEHPAMLEFDRLSDMEMSEVTEVGTEGLLNCIHGEYELLGGLRATVGYLKGIGNGLVIYIGVNAITYLLEFLIVEL